LNKARWQHQRGGIEQHAGRAVAMPTRCQGRFNALRIRAGCAYLKRRRLHAGPFARLSGVADRDRGMFPVFETAFIQEQGNGRLGYESRLVLDYCAAQGIPTQLYTEKRIVRRQLPLTARRWSRPTTVTRSAPTGSPAEPTRNRRLPGGAS
jgi:hypothetical protein